MEVMLNSDLILHTKLLAMKSQICIRIIFVARMA